MAKKAKKSNKKKNVALMFGLGAEMPMGKPNRNAVGGLEDDIDEEELYPPKKKKKGKRVPLEQLGGW